MVSQILGQSTLSPLSVQQSPLSSHNLPSQQIHDIKQNQQIQQNIKSVDQRVRRNAPHDFLLNKLARQYLALKHLDLKSSTCDPFKPGSRWVIVFVSK